jgi:hypothetical protein
MFAIKLESGWAKKDRLEGWIGSYIQTDAFTFATDVEAEAIRVRHYASGYGKTEVVPMDDQEWIVQHHVVSDPSKRGHWYECRRVKAPTLETARKLAFPPNGKSLSGYRLVTA